MCVCVYSCVCVCVFMCVCVCVCIHVCVCLCVFMCVCMCVCLCDCSSTPPWPISSNKLYSNVNNLVDETIPKENPYGYGDESIYACVCPSRQEQVCSNVCGYSGHGCGFVVFRDSGQEEADTARVVGHRAELSEGTASHY